MCRGGTWAELANLAWWLQISPLLMLWGKPSILELSRNMLEVLQELIFPLRNTGVSLKCREETKRGEYSTLFFKF